MVIKILHRHLIELTKTSYYVLKWGYLLQMYVPLNILKQCFTYKKEMPTLKQAPSQNTEIL